MKINPKIERVIFEKLKIAVDAKFSGEFIRELDLKTGQDMLDFELNTFTVQLETFILARKDSKQVFHVQADRPTFLDWLFRRKRSFTLVVECMEVMKHPPVLARGQGVIMFRPLENYPGIVDIPPTT